jgi:uncharacterized protein
MPRALDVVLNDLTSAGVPWLAVAMTGRGDQARSVVDACGGTIVRVGDPHVPPVTVNPLEPEPGFPVQAHARRVAELLEAVFGLAGPVAEVIRAGLWRAYADCEWDVVTGATPPGARTPPAAPAFTRLRRAAVAAAQDLGCDASLRAAVRGFIRTRLEPVWTGPAGRFLEGGHPADMAALLRGNVLLAGDGLAGDEVASFLAAVVMARVAERLYVPGRHPGRFALVLALDPETDRGPETAGWFSRVAREIRAHGADVITAEQAGAAAGSARSAAGPGEAGPWAAVLRGRRSAACGAECRRDRPCTGYELHAAELLARDDDQAWLRLWGQTLLLAFLAGRPLPGVPVGPLASWQALSPRRRECALATVLDRAVTARAAALRPYYDPAILMSVVAAVAARMLEATAGPSRAGPFRTVPFRAGPAWVIPQLRWLHEIERLDPLGGAGIRLDDLAPPLDFGLAGLPDWPGIRVGDRLGALARHPLSTASPRNRRLARVALLGEDGRAGLDADLAAAAPGIEPASRLRYAARLMGAGTCGPEPGWLEVVLSWPDRIIQPARDTDLRPTATG